LKKIHWEVDLSLFQQVNSITTKPGFKNCCVFTPTILPLVEIEPVYAPLVSIGREVGTAVGSIDNLFMSQQGYLVLVETELWRNPQSRREVVVQAIDYGASLAKWSFNDLDTVVRKYTQAYEKSEHGLVEWVEQHGPIEGGREYFEEMVSKNLRLGRFVTVIVGDHIQQSLKDLLSQVNRYPHLAMDVAMVELACYRWHAKEDWPLVVVPDLIARTEIVERSVVQVTLVERGKYDVDVIQEKAPGEEAGRTRKFLTEDAYWDLHKERSPETYQVAYDLIEYYQHIDGITIDTSQASIVTRLDIQESGEKSTLFYIDNRGYLVTWPGTIRQQVIRAGFSGTLVDDYETAMKKC
jgi:hypothetical protein